MNCIFFGDSITEGSNSEKRFTDYLRDEGVSVINKGVSGTTIGEYSIYPVDGNSLLSIYKCEPLRCSDKVFLEYGINDVTASMCGFENIDNVIISFVKALDGIKQFVNPETKIYFLSISNDDDIILEYAKRQCDYLKYDYFKEYDELKFPPTIWAERYIQFIRGVGRKLKVIPMITDISFLVEYISEDNLHPDEQGHLIIAKNIMRYL